MAASPNTAATSLDELFKSWVPGWLITIVGLIILVPIVFVNGAYIGSNVDISGFLGILSEDINMAYYISSVGFAIGYFVLYKTKNIIATKTVFIMVLLVQVGLSLICAMTRFIEIIIICSFFIGFFKSFCMLEVMLLLKNALSPSGTMNEFYSIYYPISNILGQLSLFLTAELAYFYNWQYMYFLIIILLLLALIAVIVCMTSSGMPFRLPKRIDWLSVIIISLCFSGIVYVATYGKVEDWFASEKITIATIMVVLTGWAFVRRLFTRKLSPYLTVLKNRNSRVIYLLSFVLMFYVSFSILISNYTTGVLRLDGPHVNTLNLYMIPGLIAGGFVTYFWYKKVLRMAWLIFLGFALFTLSIALLYFQIMPGGLYENMYLLMFLRGAALIILFVAFSIYARHGLEPHQMLFNAFFIISTRSALAPPVCSSVLTNWLYFLQQKNINLLMQGVDMQHPLAASQFTASVNNAMQQGLSIENAGIIATNSLYQSINIQAMTVSIKIIAGWMVIGGITVLVGILLYFFRYKPVKWIKMGDIADV